MTHGVRSESAPATAPVLAGRGKRLSAKGTRATLAGPGRRSALLGVGAAALCGLTSPALAQSADVRLPPPDSAEREVVVYSTTDQDEVDDLVEVFQSRNPGLRIRYGKLNSDDIYARVVQDVASGQGTADLVWSSAMDLQMKLVNDGYAQTAMVGGFADLPKWAAWKQQAYGVTAEPIVFAYNRNCIAPNDVPRSHASLRTFLERNADAVRGQIAAYDPERSGTGLLFYDQDVGITPRTWDLVSAIGRSDPRLLVTTSSMLEGVSSGRLLFAYNVIGSYAMARAQRDSALGVVIPSDYHLLMSRIAFVPAAARNPQPGKAFLDFLLSKTGQTLLTKQHLGSVRGDVARTQDEADGDADRAQPIHIGPALLANLDQARRASFIRQWRHALQSG